MQRKILAALYAIVVSCLFFLGLSLFAVFSMTGHRQPDRPVATVTSGSDQGHKVNERVGVEVPTTTLEQIGKTPAPSPSPSPPAPNATFAPSTSTPQFVIFAFDGSRSIQTWQKTREFAQTMATQGKPIKFTYFISGVYLLKYQNRMLYSPPEEKPGSSAIGFADSSSDVANRVEQINLAIKEGHEIGSHAVGHFDGSQWTLQDWMTELTAFRELVTDVSKNNDLAKEPAERRSIDLPSGKVSGFRAPLLGRDAAMYEALAQQGYRYDTSGVGKPGVWPTKDKNGLWLFPLAKIAYATTSNSLLSMDYNFYFKQSDGKDVAKRGSDQWNYFFDATLASYTKYFDDSYRGNRAPVFIGSHFSDWNDGVYWEAMQSFAEKVCGLPDVRCATYSQLADYLDGHSTE